MSTKSQPGRGSQKPRFPYISATKGKRSWAKSGGHRTLWGITATLVVR